VKKKDYFIVAAVCLLLIGVAIPGALYGSSIWLIKHFQLEGIEPTLRLAFILREADSVKIHKLATICIGASILVPIVFFGGIGIAACMPKKRELHGSARFATWQELQHGGLLEPDKESDQYPSIIVGKLDNKFLLFKGQQFMALSAPTRSGKGVGIVIPNLLHYRDSVVVLDVKEENYTITAGFRAKCGQQVFKFAPDAEDFVTHCWNPLTYVRDDPRFRVSDLMSISNILWPKTRDDVWATTAENAFLALALYCMETAKERDSFNLSHISKLFSSLTWLENEKTCRDYIKSREDYEPLSEDCTYRLIALAKNEGKVRNSIEISFMEPLGVFGDPITAKATSSSSFDFRDVRRKRMSIYVCIKPKNIGKFGKLLNLFFEQLLAMNLDTLPKDDPSLKYQCLLMLDEFPAMGRVSIIEKASAYMAGYNMRLLLIFQSNGQIEDERMYGKTGARNLMTNMGLQVLYAPREQQDANDYSEMIGFMTEKGISRSRQVGLGGKGGASESTSDQRRALLLPQEVKEIGADKEIIAMENMKPALVDKIRYYNEELFKRRINLPLPMVPSQEDLHNVIAAAAPSPVAVFQGQISAQEMPAGATFEVGFSPKRNALEVVISTILEAKHELLVAAYSFTSKEIAFALVEAKQRGVDVRLVVDHEQNDDEQGGYKAVDYMLANSVPVVRSRNYSAMHHKFMVADGQHVQLGSFNYTASANVRNAETALSLRNCGPLAELYRNEWMRLSTEPQVGVDGIIAVDKGLEALKKLGL